MYIYLVEVEVRLKNRFNEYITERHIVAPDIAHKSLIEAQQSAFRTAILNLKLWKNYGYPDVKVRPKVRKVYLIGG